MRIFVVIAGLFELIACIAWAVWIVPSEAGLLRYVAYVPSAVLFIGFVACALAAYRMGKDRVLVDELRHIRYDSPTDEKLAELIKNRLDSYQGLREWGLITEDELVERRRALLHLEEPPSANG